MKPLLVGEANPYGADPSMALYPLPERASGDRLCTLIMQMKRGDYIHRFDRVNLCPTKWSAPQARQNAAVIRAEGRKSIVLLGQKVANAFGFDYEPFTVKAISNPALVLGVTRIALLPHPSGLCRAWNEPGAFERARLVLREAAVLPCLGCGKTPCDPAEHRMPCGCEDGQHEPDCEKGPASR